MLAFLVIASSQFLKSYSLADIPVMPVSMAVAYAKGKPLSLCIVGGDGRAYLGETGSLRKLATPREVDETISDGKSFYFINRGSLLDVQSRELIPRGRIRDFRADATTGQWFLQCIGPRWHPSKSVPFRAVYLRPSVDPQDSIEFANGGKSILTQSRSGAIRFTQGGLLKLQIPGRDGGEVRCGRISPKGVPFFLRVDGALGFYDKTRFTTVLTLADADGFIFCGGNLLVFRADQAYLYDINGKGLGHSQGFGASIVCAYPVTALRKVILATRDGNIYELVQLPG